MRERNQWILVAMSNEIQLHPNSPRGNINMIIGHVHTFWTMIREHLFFVPFSKPEQCSDFCCPIHPPLNQNNNIFKAYCFPNPNIHNLLIPLTAEFKMKGGTSFIWWGYPTYSDLENGAEKWMVPYKYQFGCFVHRQFYFIMQGTNIWIP